MTLTDNPVFAVALMLAGCAAGLAWYGIRLGKNGLPARAALLGALTGPLLALICAKAGYLLHDLGASLFEGYFEDAVSLRPEHLSFVGGCAGFTAGIAAAAKWNGVRPAKALDLFAAPGCVFLCLARIAEGGMDTVGMGNETEAAWLQFFPLTMRNSWGDAYLCVFVLEALTALACLVPALRKPPKDSRDGLTFERTAVCLLGAQAGWEMLLQYPYIRTFLTSFVSLEQVICAVLLIALVIRGCAKSKKWWPVPVTAALLGLSAFFQFFRDNKIEILFEEGWEGVLENAETISFAAFAVISAALILTALKAIAPGAGNKTR